jgi:serine/threonine protein kinase/Tol biopolymer transport system component
MAFGSSSGPGAHAAGKGVQPMTADQDPHPPADTLRAFGEGTLDGALARGLRRHLEGCPDCRRAVAAFCRVAEGHPAAAVADLPPELANHPQYEVVRELGRGGMGVVYLARNRLMDRPEVLKLVSPQFLGHPETVQRFLREIRSAARLSHPNIVTAHAAFQLGDLLVLAMEFVPGEDVGRVVESRGPLPVGNACYYAQQAALGLQHAFERGMIHRDIKPHNLILVRDAKKHVVKVLDFGLAKATREEGASPERTGPHRKLTTVGVMMGTPDYIAPEQALDAAGADIRADIYSLGCTLYFLLTGAPPFRGDSMMEVVQAHMSADAPPLDRVRPGVPAELAAVAAKMLAKKPANRYQKPVEVAQALAPFVKGAVRPLPPPPTAATQANVPVAVAVGKTRADGASGHDTTGPAPAPTRAEARPRKRAAAGPAAPASRGWALALGLCAASVLVLAGVIALAVTGGFRTTPPEGIVDLEVNEANPDVFVDGDPVAVAWEPGGKAGDMRLAPGTHKVELRKEGFLAVVKEVEVRDGERQGLPVWFDRVPPVPPPPWPPPPPPAAPPEKPVADAYDLTGGYRFVHFGPNGPRVVLFNRNEKLDKEQEFFAHVYDLTTGKPIGRPLKHASTIQQAAFSPDGEQVVTASNAGAQVWRADNGQPLTLPLDHKGGVVHAAFSPDGKRVLTVGNARAALFWDATTGNLLGTILPFNPVRHAAFSPDGKWIVTATRDPTWAQVWDAVTGKALGPSLEHRSTVNHVAFSPDGKRIVTASEDKTARVWDATTGEPRGRPLIHDDSVLHAVFSPDGKRVVTASKDKTARLWDAGKGDLLKLLEHRSEVFHAAFSPDGKRVVTASWDDTAQIWDVATGMTFGPSLKHRGVKHAAFSPDGKRLVTTSGVTALLWDVESGQELKNATLSEK